MKFPPATLARSIMVDPAVRTLSRLVFAVRAAMLDRPAARAVLRVLGRPAIALVHRLSGRSAPPPPTPAAFLEPVLRLPLAYVPAPAAAPPTAVLLHAYYVDLLPEVMGKLRNLPPGADIYVSTDTAQKQAEIRERFRDWDRGQVEVRVAPNRGRNVAPQLVTFHDVYSRYDLVLLIHTKKSLHTEGLANWRDRVFGDLMGSPQVVAGVMEVFARQPLIGVLAPRNVDFVRLDMVWDKNYAAGRKLARRMGFALHPDSPLDFPAGGMFWARSAALQPLLDLGLSANDFEPEAGQIDGTLAHALERLPFHACEMAGLRWARIGDGRAASRHEVDVLADRPRALADLTTKFSRTLLAPGRRPDPTGRPALSRDARRALYRQELAEFLAGQDRLALPVSEHPKVSLLVVLFNQADLTLQCLKSLQFALDGPCEVIVVDNASSDETQTLMGRIDGVRYVRNAQNLHFLRAANQAAALASGEHLLFLNNDTRLTPGSIAAAVERLSAEPDLGAVGGRIELADGTLQEAGDIVWADGSCSGYGRGQEPEASEFQFRRDVDYVSGAFLMTPRALFADMGGFDEAFAPAYYEETDYCMRLWARGLRVSYEPRVRLFHFEFGSSASAGDALALQEAHRGVFAARHAEVLADRPRMGSSALAMRMRDARRRVLIIDDFVPLPDLGAGAPRAIDLIGAATDAGWFVTVYPLLEDGCDYAAAYRVLRPGVEIAAERGEAGLAAFMRARAGYYDAAIVSRPDNMRTFRAALRRVPGFLSLSQVVYDAEAVFALRDPAVREDSAVVKAELALAKGAGGVLVVSPQEGRLFTAAGAGPVEVVGHARRPRPTPSPFAARRDLLFVGALEDEGPNTDSLAFFVEAVMPELDRLIGRDWILRAAGRNGSPRIQALAGERVRLLGPVADLTPLYDQSRVFIAPTRFAAGIPMKVHEAAAQGLPAAVTPLLAGQLGWGEDAVGIGEGAEGFARAVAGLYTDEARWRAGRNAALARLATDCDPAVFAARLTSALDRAAAGR